MSNNDNISQNDDKVLSPDIQRQPIFPMPILMPIPVYTPSYRKTHSDVLCFSTSAVKEDYDTKKKKKLDLLCKLPYEELSGKHNYHRKHQTPIEKKQCERSREKLDKELHNEHRTFMENLRNEREKQMHRETKAAITVQRYMMGLHVRRNKFPNKFPKPASQFQMSEEEIMNFLVESASKCVSFDTNVFPLHFDE